MFQKVFPNSRLRPKHHYLEHYPHLIKVFGPLVDVWTMRYEGKHKFFKRVIREAQNFMNVPLTLAQRHQSMMAYHLDSASFFKPSLEVDKVKSVAVASFPDSVQHQLSKHSTQSTVLKASSVHVDGIKYATGMVISVGSCAGLPEFKQIDEILVVNADVLFICKSLIAWYHEHLRAYELCKSTVSLAVPQLRHLNDVFTLSAYKVKDEMFVSLKRYILC